MAAEVIAGRFELIEHIAQGGSGSVWLARDLQHSIRCAAKVMRQSYSGELLRFVREQGVKFDHRHLLTPYGWAAMDDQVVIVSQLMRGGNLHTAMADYGAFSVELVAEILSQLLEGLDHVHAAGWVHRDVKPANVLLEFTGATVPQVRLTDFGIATHRDAPRLTQVGVSVGTEGFLAPEQRAGKDPEAAQDLYALGVVGVQLLNPSLRGDELRSWCEQLAANPQLVSAPLGPLLAGLLAADPARREDTASQAAERLHPLRNRQGYRVASGEIFEVFDHFAQDGDAPRTAPDVALAEPVTQVATTQGTLQQTPIPPAQSQTQLPAASQRSWQPWGLLLLALLLGLLSLWLVFGDSAAAQPVSLDQAAEQIAVPPDIQRHSSSLPEAPGAQQQ